jgi:hypothetical protein
MGKRSVCAVLVAAVVAAALAPINAHGRSGSGVRGKVLYGPTCPVERIGQSCVEPYDAALRIRRQSTRKTVAKLRSGDDGRFTVRLRPGHYIIEPTSGHPYPRASPEVVLVHAHRFTRVTIRFDSGIR